MAEKKIVTIVGARPQFIKAATVSRELKSPNLSLKEIIIHTGQHFDTNMSDVFFKDLDIPMPNYNLSISGGSHGHMTGRMIVEIENILTIEKPDWVLVYGDTNSTLAGSIAASKLHIPIIHIEAGLRSFNNKMPEEINRIVSDRIATVHFCTSDLAVENLRAEGITKNVYNTGDVMYDAALFYSEDKNNTILQNLGVEKNNFILVTCHRAENTDNKEKLENILSALQIVANDIPVIFPIHPRTRKSIEAYNLSDYLSSLKIISPLSYVDMIILEKNAKCIVTDSGGVQKEAYFFKTPCITIREETEWVETLEGGANILVGSNKENIIDRVKNINVELWPFENLYGDGKASKKIVAHIKELSIQGLCK